MAGEVIRRRQVVTITRYAMKANDRGGRSVDHDTFTNETHDIEIEIDINGLFETLGKQAARAKGGRSQEAGGLVVARRMRRA